MDLRAGCVERGEAGLDCGGRPTASLAADASTASPFATAVRLAEVEAIEADCLCAALAAGSAREKLASERLEGNRAFGDLLMARLVPQLGAPALVLGRVREARVR